MSSLKELDLDRRPGTCVLFRDVWPCDDIASSVPTVAHDPRRARERGRQRSEGPGVRDLDQGSEEPMPRSIYRAEPRQTQSLTSRNRVVPVQPAHLADRPEGRLPRRHGQMQSGSRGRGYVAHDPFRPTTGQDEEAVAGRTTWDDIEVRPRHPSSRPSSSRSRYGRPAEPLRAPRLYGSAQPAHLIGISEEDSVFDALERPPLRRRSSRSPSPLPAPPLHWNGTSEGIPAQRPSSVHSDVVFVRRPKRSRQVVEGDEPQAQHSGPLNPPPSPPRYHSAPPSPVASAGSIAPVSPQYSPTPIATMPAESLSSHGDSPRGRRAESLPIAEPTPPVIIYHKRPNDSISRSASGGSRSRRRQLSQSASIPSLCYRRYRSRSQSRSRSRSRERERERAEEYKHSGDPVHRTSTLNDKLWLSKNGKDLQLLSPTSMAEVSVKDVEAAVAPQKRASTLEWLVVYSTKGIPREAYNYFLLRLPSLYFSRVARIFEEADLSLGEIKEMVLESASKSKAMHVDDFFMESQTATSPAYESLKRTWEGFIDSVMREWKTFNIISVLLLS
jgi:hypothetical protein